jgi:ferredoxin
MEISWTDCVKNEEVLQRIKEERNLLNKKKRGLANCIGHLLCRNCLLRVTEGKVHGTMEGPGRHEQLLKIERGSTRSNSLENSLWKRL